MPRKLERERGGWSICINYPDNCPPPQAIVTEMKQYSIGYRLGLFRRLPTAPSTRGAQSRSSINFIPRTVGELSWVGEGCLVQPKALGVGELRRKVDNGGGTLLTRNPTVSNCKSRFLDINILCRLKIIYIKSILTQRNWSEGC